MRRSFQLNTTPLELLQLHQQFEYSTSLQGKQSNQEYSAYQSIHAFGAINSLKRNTGNALEHLQELIDVQNDYLFGCLGYDLKNEIYGLNSLNANELEFPDLFFFVPKYVVKQKGNHYVLECFSEEEAIDFKQLLQKQKTTHSIRRNPLIELSKRTTKENYIRQFQQIANHIQIGNFYEMNYCQEFYQKNILLDPYALFGKMTETIQAPFMAFVKNQHQYLLSGSPERYLLKQENRLISQPIKGTAKRGVTPEDDVQIKERLANSLKERTENVMIVDLVRNDLGRVCKVGTVKVPELHQLYSFSTVHQLISTITGELKENTSFTDIMRATFPMGSMTGAPKYKVLQITEEVEDFKRGWYSGAVGYIEPNGNFDFNVIIRSFLYDSKQKYLSYGVGGGITAAANAEEEYEECLLKVNSFLNKIQ